MKVTDLIKIGKHSLEIFDKYIKEKNIKPPKRVYIRHFYTKLEISETHCEGQSSLEIIHKSDWLKIVFDFMDKIIKPLPEFKKLNQSITKRYKKNINILAKSSNELTQSAFWLETFIRNLIFDKLDGSYSEDLLIEYASLFKSELELSPTKEYRYVHSLEAIFLERDSIRINDNILIRRTQKSDLEFTRDFFYDFYLERHMGIPSSILEIDISAKDEKECYGYVDRIFNAMRLYKLGSIYPIKSTLSKKTVIKAIGHTSWGSRNYSIFKKYTVNNLEVNSFIKFVNTIEQKLDFNKEEKKYRILHISIGRYNSALLESMDIERKLMTAVMGLESLFTFEKDRGENAFKLSVRVAKLLGNMNFDAINVRVIIQRAYIFRNMVVHGSYISLKDRKEINEIFPYILNYLRVSLIIFLLNQEIGKDKIVEMIDKSIISNTENENMRKKLDISTKEFSGCIFDL